VRAVSYTIHGLIPASCVFADRYNREEVVASLGREINHNPPLTLGQLPDTSEELLKLDQVSQSYEIISCLNILCVSQALAKIRNCLVSVSPNFFRQTFYVRRQKISM
jgi:hypothetical protein